VRLTPSAHVDTFCRDRQPPADQWPDLLPATAYPDRLNCADELLSGTIARFGADRRCLVASGATWSYGDLLREVDRLAHLLTCDLGLVAGGRVLLRGPNSPWLVACWLAVAKAGGVVVCTTPLLRAHELRDVIRLGKPTIALCHSDFIDELRSAGDLRVVLFDDDGGDLARRSAAHDRPFTAAPTAADDVALLSFSSGTTGKAKCAMHFHRDVLGFADTFSRHVLKPRPDDLFAGTPSLGFTYGLGGLLVSPLRAGAAAVFPEPTADLATTVAEYGVTVLIAVPTTYRAFLHDEATARLRPLRRCVSAGEPLPAATRTSFEAVTGLRIIDGLGSSELLHIFVSAADGDIRPGTVGLPVPGYEVAVLDEAGVPLPDGRVGRLSVRGPAGCRYMEGGPQSTYVRDGWNVTGDLCSRDADGYVTYFARADDLIVSSGYNIAPAEIEEALNAHPQVAESAVVGAPDEQRGTVVKAYVVPAEGARLDDAAVRAIQDFVKQRIAPFKYPRVVEVVVALPRTRTGKLQRHRVREASSEPGALERVRR
jgi:2-aminobenzoate-CoA ligase